MRVLFSSLILFCCVLGQPCLAQITVSPWQMHEGKGQQAFTSNGHGNPGAYALADIPDAKNAGWKAAETGADGEVIFDRRSTLPCLKAVDFTYFQTEVFIPENVDVNKFNVNFLQADDGARIYIFNSSNPKGAFDPKADLRFGQPNPGTVDLRRFVKKGETNRVVVVQFDDCAIGNHVHGIQVKVNGDIIKAEPVATAPELPTYMVLKTFSVHEGKKQQDAYWVAEKGGKLGIATAAQCTNGQATLIRFITDGYSGKCALIANGSYALVPGSNGTIERKGFGDEMPSSYYWDVRPCLSSKASGGNYVSFEHPSQPGYFLRHTSYTLKCDKNNKTELFRQDASWKFEEISVEELMDTSSLPAVCRTSGGGNSTSTVTTSTTQTYTAPYGSSMKAGDRLEMGQELVSSDGSCRMRMQYDGNLAIYRSGKYVWDAKCPNQGSYVTLQSDGNFVCYSKSNKAVWSSETHPYFDKRYTQSTYKPVSCVMTNEGNCALKNRAGQSVWTCGQKTGAMEVSSNSGTASSSTANKGNNQTYTAPYGSTMQPGNRLEMGQELVSSDGNCRMRMQYDGNLAIYRSGKYVWDAKCANQGSYVTLQSDGNFVCYSKSNKAVWSSETHPYFDKRYIQSTYKPVSCVMTNEGNCALKNRAGQSVWTCGQKTGAVEISSGNSATTSSGTFDPGKFYRLTTGWQGPGKSLDIVNDGSNRTPRLAKTGGYSGQSWKITPAGNGFYRLSTRWQGEDKPLDIVSGDGKENRPILATAKNDNWAGQFWKITPLGDGFYRLTTKWKGEGMSLDIVNDGKKDTPILAKSGEYSGQAWKIEEIK